MYASALEKINSSKCWKKLFYNISQSSVLPYKQLLSFVMDNLENVWTHRMVAKTLSIVFIWRILKLQGLWTDEKKIFRSIFVSIFRKWYRYIPSYLIKRPVFCRKKFFAKIHYGWIYFWFIPIPFLSDFYVNMNDYIHNALIDLSVLNI